MHLHVPGGYSMFAWPLARRTIHPFQSMESDFFLAENWSLTCPGSLLDRERRNRDQAVSSCVMHVRGVCRTGSRVRCHVRGEVRLWRSSIAGGCRTTVTHAQREAAARTRCGPAKSEKGRLADILGRPHLLP